VLHVLVFQILAFLNHGIYCRGLGRQASLMWFNIIGFWVVGFTTGYLLTFKANYGLAGIWWGIFWGISVTGECPALFCLAPLTRSADTHVEGV